MKEVTHWKNIREWDVFWCMYGYHNAGYMGLPLIITTAVDRETKLYCPHCNNWTNNELFFANHKYIGNLEELDGWNHRWDVKE